MENSKIVIKTENLTKIYGEGEVAVRAINNVDLTIKAGEFTALVGPSGSGKTTLWNMIGGVDAPTSGKRGSDKEEIATLRNNRMIDFRLHNIGFVFQAYNLNPV